MAEKRLQELSRIRINVTKYEEPIITWHLTFLTLLTEKGIHIFEFSHDIRSLEKKIDFVQSLIGHPKSSPAACLFTDRVLNKNLRNMDLTEMIVDHTLWSHNPQLLQEMSSIVNFEWSPGGVTYNNDPAIAVITNVGVVEIYTQELSGWTCALEISMLLHLEYMVNADIPRSFDILKDMVYTLASTAMSWSPVLNADNSCFFVTAQKDGKITFWLVQCIGKHLSAKILGNFESGSSEILSILWIPKLDSTFLLVCLNVLGQIIVYNGKVEENSMHFSKTQMIWPYKDRMITKMLQYVELNNKIVLVCNKNRHLLVLMLDSENNMTSQCINNINDYRITSITKACDDIYVTTVNCKIFKMFLSAADDNLEISLEAIEYQGLSSTHELYGISFSMNNTLCSITAIDRKINCKKNPKQIEVILYSTKEKLDSLIVSLLANPTKKLTQYWDVIEVLRCKTMKTKEAPLVDYNQLYEMACSDHYILKVYLILSTLCDNLKKLFRISPNFNLPENSTEVVKEEILVAHADKQLHMYYKKFQEDKLDNTDIEHFIGAKKFLEHYLLKNKKDLLSVIDPNVLNIVDRNHSYICQWCDEEVTGFTCGNEHPNMFCALTFTPIYKDSYLVCKWCNLTARVELLLERPTCLFCDVNLKYVC